jgi:hypothetical protein
VAPPLPLRQSVLRSFGHVRLALYALHVLVRYAFLPWAAGVRHRQCAGRRCRRSRRGQIHFAARPRTVQADQTCGADYWFGGAASPVNPATGGDGHRWQGPPLSIATSFRCAVLPQPDAQIAQTSFAGVRRFRLREPNLPRITAFALRFTSALCSAVMAPARYRARALILINRAVGTSVIGKIRPSSSHPKRMTVLRSPVSGRTCSGSVSYCMCRQLAQFCPPDEN